MRILSGDRSSKSRAQSEKDDDRKPQDPFTASVRSFRARFGPNDDQSTVPESARALRAQTAAQGVDQYYDFATSAYEAGWGTHFHYTPFAPGDSIAQALAFYEHKLALLMGLRPGMKVLDVGCGVGGPAREIAKFVGCEIVGITINQVQVDRAKLLTEQMGLGGRCTFIRGDFMNLPFPDASFDAAYAIEATVMAPSLEHCYAGIARVLKPGAVFGLSEWVLTSKFDASNPHHIGIRNRIERGNAIANHATVADARAAMLAAGFTLLHDEDFATHFDYMTPDPRRCQEHAPTLMPSPVLIPADPSAPPTSPRSTPYTAAAPSRALTITTYPPHRPWYFPLVGDTALACTAEDRAKTFRMSKWPRRLSRRWVYVAEKLGIADKGHIEAMKTIFYCVDSVAEGGKEGVFSPCWWMIGRKAEAKKQDLDSLGAEIARDSERQDDVHAEWENWKVPSQKRA